MEILSMNEHNSNQKKQPIFVQVRTRFLNTVRKKNEGKKNRKTTTTSTKCVILNGELNAIKTREWAAVSQNVTKKRITDPFLGVADFGKYCN
jgi:hypothetical protein